MKTKLLVGLAVAALAALVTVGASAGEDNTWVTDDGHAILLHEHNAIFLGEDGETFDVSNLRDGESRTLGTGAKQVTVTRMDDEVVISRPAQGDEDALEIKCDTTRDSCKVVTFNEDPEKVMIVVEKTRECVNGVGDCDPHAVVNVDALGEGKRHIMIKKLHCDDAGDCSEMTDVVRDVTVTLDEAGDGAHAVFVRKPFDGKVQLTCPEGDASIRVDQEEADEVFLCPKHSVPMEQQQTRMMKIEIDD